MTFGSCGKIIDDLRTKLQPDGLQTVQCTQRNNFYSSLSVIKIDVKDE